jgi:TatA/E family protein of Tat protein translocase
LFGLSGWELAIIVLFGFMIFGPDKLPQIARTVGRAIRQFRSAQEQMNKVIKAEVYDPLKDLEPLANPFSGFSLEESKDDAKKQGSTKPGAKTTSSTKAVKKTDTAKPASTTKAGEDVQSDKKIASGDLKAALSEEAAKAKEKAGKQAAGKAAGAAAASESFAQRRARLEREHAKAKEKTQQDGASSDAAADAAVATATTKADASDVRKEDEKGA